MPLLISGQMHVAERHQESWVDVLRGTRMKRWRWGGVVAGVLLDGAVGRVCLGHAWAGAEDARSVLDSRGARLVQGRSRVLVVLKLGPRQETRPWVVYPRLGASAALAAAATASGGGEAAAAAAVVEALSLGRSWRGRIRGAVPAPVRWRYTISVW